VVPLEELCGKRFAAPAAALRMMGLLCLQHTRRMGRSLAARTPGARAFARGHSVRGR